MQNTSEEYVIFVGGLDDDIDLNDLKDAFEVFGNTRYCKINLGGRSGYVSYFHKVDAENAIARMNGRYLKHKRIKTEWARHPTRNIHENVPMNTRTTRQMFDLVFNKSCSTNRTVYCSGLDDDKQNPTITYNLLNSTFSRFGDIRYISDHFKHERYTFICYTTKEAAALAICEVDKTRIGGFLVSCNWSHTQERVSQTPRSLQLEGTSTITSCNSSASTTVSSNSSTTASSNSSTTASSNSSTTASSNSSTTASSNSFTTASNFFDCLQHLCDILSTFPDSTASTTVSSKSADSAAVSFKKDAPKAVVKEKERNPDLMCKICMDKELGVVFQPCGHLTACRECAQRLQNCPLCRTEISSTVRTYLS